MSFCSFTQSCSSSFLSLFSSFCRVEFMFYPFCCHGYCWFIHYFKLPSVDPPFHCVFFCPPLCVFFCGVRLCRVSCVFLCTSWRSEGSPRLPGPSAPCSTWPHPDTPSPRQRQQRPRLDPPSTCRRHGRHRTRSVRLWWRSWVLRWRSCSRWRTDKNWKLIQNQTELVWIWWRLEHWRSEQTTEPSDCSSKYQRASRPVRNRYSPTDVVFISVFDSFRSSADRANR